VLLRRTGCAVQAQRNIDAMIVGPSFRPLFRGGICRIAFDSCHRYPEDIEWMVRLGVNACRMGIEWSRLQTAPCAPLDPAELARYQDILDRLQAAGIVPVIVLHHFSNPSWAAAAGGWTNPATIPIFVD
jgi:beta-glucosidase/6-phospho-beta-glucosidase/beta-galactosidase